MLTFKPKLIVTSNQMFFYQNVYVTAIVSPVNVTNKIYCGTDKVVKSKKNLSLNKL